MILIEVRTDGHIQGSEQLSAKVKPVSQTMLDRGFLCGIACNRGLVSLLGGLRK
jgi:hypothetical protein